MKSPSVRVCSAGKPNKPSFCVRQVVNKLANVAFSNTKVGKYILSLMFPEVRRACGALVNLNDINPVEGSPDLSKQSITSGISGISGINSYQKPKEEPKEELPVSEGSLVCVVRVGNQKIGCGSEAIAQKFFDYIAIAGQLGNKFVEYQQDQDNMVDSGDQQGIQLTTLFGSESTDTKTPRFDYKFVYPTLGSIFYSDQTPPLDSK